MLLTRKVVQYATLRFTEGNSVTAKLNCLIIFNSIYNLKILATLTSVGIFCII